ncbi:MAG: pyrroline-5-carboxylate reductase [Chitinophagales bacterium]|nr:MAG: pyrroline-5-carboxylate reductase [Chitinophagales bacterium]
MIESNIAIIGGGNLGIALAEGFLKSANIPASRLTVTRRKIQLLQALKDKGVTVHSDNVQAVKHADWIILAIKPKQILDVLKEIAPYLRDDKHLLISVATGVSISELEAIAGSQIPLFRAMPNTAAAIGESMTCISTKNGTPQQQQQVIHLFEQIGRAIVIEEELMSAATVLAACGIAYSLRYIRAASQGGIEIGFDAATAQLIAAQTVKGAASLLIERGEHPEREIDRVTTPQGCTIAGINEMEHQGFSSSLIKGIMTSYKTIEKLH